MRTDFMESLRYFVKRLKYAIYVTLLLSIFSCERKPEKLSGSLSYSEKRTLEQFFHQLVFQEGGAYTLFGNKPITWVMLSPQVLASLDSDAVLDQFFTFSTKEERSHVIWDEDHLKDGWECWITVANRYPSKNYLLINRPFISAYSEGSNFSCIMLVNKKELEYVLNHYHDDFEGIVGKPFNSLEMVDELSFSDSYFWDTIFRHEALTGIVLGYGYMNSWIYHWKKQYKSDDGERGEYFRNLSQPLTKLKTQLDCPLPVFAHVDSSMQQHYERVQKKIIEEYKNEDCLEVTLKRFVSN